MVQVPSIPPWLPLQQLFLLVAVLGSLVAARRFSPDEPRWGNLLRRRFVLGVPWGSVLTVLGVVSVYWILQGGWADPQRPLSIPYYSWSYFYPLGMVVSSFAHRSLGHVTGNMIGTVAFAPIVEYAWGHYPRGRGSESFASLRTNPYARILAVPVGAALVGLFTSVFSLGPVIGFSGVVFAFAGFAFVTRPLMAIAALVASDTLRLFWRAIRNPQITARAGPGFSSPWFADVAIQGHAMGLLAGVVLGVYVLDRRESTPNPLYLWLAAVLYAVDQTLWAVYLPTGSSEYILFRAVGLGLVFVLAAMIVAAVATSDRPLVPGIDLSRRETAVGAVVVLLLAVSVVAVPFNLTTVEGPVSPGTETIDIRDYTVTYVENEPNRFATVVDTSVFGEISDLRSSGVVVYSERRNVWYEAIPKGRLKSAGRSSVQIGGIGWSERVFAFREGWSAVGNGSTYRVSLQHGGDRRVAYTATPVRAEPILSGRNVSIAPVDGGFGLRVAEGNTTLGLAPIPDPGNETAVGGLTINRTGRDLYAIDNDTRVRIAKKNVPRSRQN